ncbi:LexA family transcriptional regulator [Achromobacter xylosoxidans]|uniref:LexA family transcriptional regulator n=1 Tax=Alcaligenes xylosoxydans xylosoxydans TaxID=85698 RepID=UPI00244BF1FF|nr:XRE family transcriptional regulator [Achromobacter xylosoxidans]MDH0520843.1 XRE family transcriptional regulator [Achromobacter xylosoxidans]MDH0544815.1 XRE family transcriptional regulator [Achromobacter xylosoxidans]
MTQAFLVSNLARMPTIHKRIKDLREKLELSMEQLAERVGVSWQTVQQWENGRTAPKRARLEAVAKALHTTPEYLAVGPVVDPDADEFVAVRRLDVRLSAGHGEIVLSEDEMSRLSFRVDFLRAAGASPQQTVSVSVKGDSMEPLIPDGATILVNRGATSIINGKIYAFRRDGELLVKRLYKGNGGFIARSENPAGGYEDLHLSLEDPQIDIIGRAFWMGCKL